MTVELTGDSEHEAFRFYCENEHRSVLETKVGSDFWSSYCGAWNSFEDFVEETFRDCNEIPHFLDMYIDFSKIARDWSLGGLYWDQMGSDGEVHVFRCL